MRILEVTFVPPDKKSGGGLGIYQSIKSLLEVGNVDYIGPQFDSDLFANTSYKINTLCVLQAGRRSLGKLLFKKVSTVFYDDWVNYVKNIKWDAYDVVHIESSRYYFVVDEAKKHKANVLVRMHNIESEYGLNLCRKNKSIGNYLRYYSYYSNEKRTVRKANGLIFLTDRDILNAHKLYNVNNAMSFKNPVCIDTDNDLKDYAKAINECHIRFLMTGTLNYGSNVDGIIWFLETVWNKNYNDDKYTLTIAGAHPNNRLKEVIAKSCNVRLVDTPEDMSPYFRAADVYIASVFDGAGMKVKVAEALSYGLPVIGTTHAYIGYEDVQYGKFLANTANEFTLQINKFVIEHLHVDRCNIFNEFYSKFSMKASEIFYKMLIEKISGEHI